MFRSFIYLNDDKLYTYKRQIDGCNAIQPRTITKKNAKDFTAGVRGFGFRGAVETDINGEIEKDVSFDYDRFELELNKLEGEDYFDFVMNPDYDFTTIPAMKILRVCSAFSIPEEFDMVNLMDRFMPAFMGEIQTNSASEQEAMENILGKASADIPIVIDADDITISGKLNAKYLREEYSSLEDYADQDVYVLCKVVGIARKDSVEIFDPLKDFIKLPRAMRRQMSDGNNGGLERIIVDGPVLKVEIIAIYK